MAKAQRKDDILKSELPPTLPLMALRSTIVYPLGTIAVQMGAPENLAVDTAKGWRELTNRRHSSVHVITEADEPSPCSVTQHPTHCRVFFTR